MQSEELKRKAVAFDDMSPDESIGAYGGSGQWVELCTVRDLRAFEAALSAAEPIGYTDASELKNKELHGLFAHIGADTSWLNGPVALYTTPPAPPAAVKALEWKEDGKYLRARMGDREYSLNITSDGETWAGCTRPYVFGHNLTWSSVPNCSKVSLEQAKAACQADCQARYAARSAQVQDMAGWQPIETAPKDGTPVILWTVWVGDEISPDPFSEVQIGYWDHGNDLPASHDFSRRPEWVVQRIGVPTHWMPLPAAPAKQEGGK